ncbi:MAG: hypothetical protein HOW73_09210 [Polyangiaceae bacterium]|nr:hypothetical protein [Polyangiaceae bacterium]
MIRPPVLASFIALALALSVVGCARGPLVAPEGTSPEVVDAWRRLNELRREAGLQAVPLDEDAGHGGALHARYLELNRRRVPREDPYSPHLQFFDYTPHEELPGRPGFTDEGREAARKSCLGYDGTARENVEAQVATFHHRMPLLSPGLQSVGMATRRSGDAVFHVIVVEIDGDDWAPFVYPVNGQQNVPLAFTTGENPEPRPVEWFNGYARGMAPRTGFPITIDFGEANVYGVEGSLQKADGTPVEAYATSVEMAFHTTGVILPRPVLEPNTSYVATFDATVVTYDGRYDRKESTRHRYTTTFRTGS